MSEAAIPLSSLVRPTLSPDWKPAFTSEVEEAMLLEKVAALESEIADWKATIIMRDNIIQLAYEEITRLTEMGGLESSFRDWMLSWPRRERKKTMPEEVAVTTVPVDTPALEVSPSVLEKLEPREYNAIRDAQEHEAKHPEPDEPAETDETSETGECATPRKSGLEKRIAKLTRSAYEERIARNAAEQRAAELEARLTSGRSTEQRSARTHRSSPKRARTESPSGLSGNNRSGEQCHHFAPTRSGHSPHRQQSRCRLCAPEIPELLKAIEREPARAAERIAELSRDLAGTPRLIQQGSRTAKPIASRAQSSESSPSSRRYLIATKLSPA